MFLRFSVFSNSAIDYLERFVFKMTCYVSSGTKSPINSTRFLSLSIRLFSPKPLHVFNLLDIFSSIAYACMLF